MSRAAAGYKHLKRAYRSGLEAAVGAALAAAGVEAQYEAVKVPFTQPEKARKYTPDWLLPNGIIVETKGLFDAADRQKHLWVKEQHPHLDIRFVFSNAKAKVGGSSVTTNAQWCDKQGFLWAHKTVPLSWLTEEASPLRVAAVTALGARLG